MPLLGNIVISKKNPTHTQDHTLIDRKRKRYDNAVDVVVRLHDRPILSNERTAPPCSAHVQLGDVPRTHDPVELEGEFHQHDGVMTVMMKLPTKGFA